MKRLVTEAPAVHAPALLFGSMRPVVTGDGAWTAEAAPVYLAVKRTGVAAHHHGFNACLKERAEKIARA